MTTHSGVCLSLLYALPPPHTACQTQFHPTAVGVAVSAAAAAYLFRNRLQNTNPSIHPPPPPPSPLLAPLLFFETESATLLCQNYTHARTHQAAQFPEGWAFKGVSCGTPGEFPDGADYGVGFDGKAPAYVTGYRSAAAAAVAASPAGAREKEEL